MQRAVGERGCGRWAGREGWLAPLRDVWGFSWKGWTTGWTTGWLQSWALRFSEVSFLTWPTVPAGCWLGPPLGVWTGTPPCGFSTGLLGCLSAWPPRDTDFGSSGTAPSHKVEATSPFTRETQQTHRIASAACCRLHGRHKPARTQGRENSTALGGEAADTSQKS